MHDPPQLANFTQAVVADIKGGQQRVVLYALQGGYLIVGEVEMSDVIGVRGKW